MSNSNKAPLTLTAAAVAGTAAIAAALAKTRAIQDEARASGGHVPNGPYEAVVKRPLDAVLAAAALVALVPVMGATALAVRAKLGSPVLFSQERPGKGAKTFTIYKFRTMTDDRDPETGELLPDEDRLTGFGKWLRSTSLDELPEIINVLKGDMSVVGPRPLLVRYLPRYNARQARRHEVRPGLTGLAQIRGRNSISWEQKFESDVEYVDGITFLDDARIVAVTVSRVLRREGISSSNHATMEEFMGTLENESSAS